MYTVYSYSIQHFIASFTFLFTVIQQKLRPKRLRIRQRSGSAFHGCRSRPRWPQPAEVQLWPASCLGSFSWPGRTGGWGWYEAEVGWWQHLPQVWQDGLLCRANQGGLPHVAPRVLHLLHVRQEAGRGHVLRQPGPRVLPALLRQELRAQGGGLRPGGGHLADKLKISIV